MDVIKLARDLGSELQKQQIYLKMVQSKKKNDEDEELQRLIGDFNLKRMDLNLEMNKNEDDKDKSKIEGLDKEIQDLYKKIMDNANMLEYNKSKQALSLLLSDINKVLSAAIAGKDPQTIDLEKNVSGCGGGCSSCGGCH